MIKLNTGLAGLLTVSHGRFSLHLGVRARFRMWGHLTHLYDGVTTHMLGAGPVALLAWHGLEPVEHDFADELSRADDWCDGSRYALRFSLAFNETQHHDKTQKG